MRIIHIHVNARSEHQAPDASISEERIQQEKIRALKDLVLFLLSTMRQLRQEYDESRVDPEYFRNRGQPRGTRDKQTINNYAHSVSSYDMPSVIDLKHDGTSGTSIAEISVSSRKSFVNGELIPLDPLHLIQQLSLYFYRQARQQDYRTLDPSLANSIETGEQLKEFPDYMVKYIYNSSALLYITILYSTT